MEQKPLGKTSVEALVEYEVF